MMVWHLSTYISLDRTTAIDGITEHVHNATQGSVTHGHKDRCTSRHANLASDETLCHVHGNATHHVVSKMLSDLKHQTHLRMVGKYSQITKYNVLTGCLCLDPFRRTSKDASTFSPLKSKTSRASKMAGNCPGGNSTSTTAPTTCATLPRNSAPFPYY